MKSGAQRRLRCAGLVVWTVCLAGAGLAAPKEGKTPGEICSTAGGRSDKAQCCEEAFQECLQSCPRGESGPSSSCGNYCDQTVRQRCLEEAVGQAGPTNTQPRAPSGGVSEPRSRGTTPARTPTAPAQPGAHTR